MFEQFNFIRSVFNQARPTLKTYVAESDIIALEQEIKQRTEEQKPVVMVYGVYNAGKSTLLNALVGEEVAAVGDIPKTDRVDAYTIGDVTILDTPGIDAPIEHEDITHEQLAKSDAVIFVLSSDGVLEEQKTYLAMGKILRAGKPMLVVVNNKSGYKPEDAEYIALVERFRENLKRHFADDEQIQQQLLQVEDFLVNARLAFKGKQENKAALVQHSQLPLLEQAVARLFAKTNSAQIAKTLAVQLQTLIKKAIAQAEQGEHSSDLMQLQELISEIKASQLRIKERTLAFASKGKASIKAELIDLLHNGQSAAVKTTVDQWQQEIISEFERQQQREMQRLDKEAEQLAQLFMQQTEELEVEQEQEFEKQSGFAELLKVLTEKNLQSGITEDMAKKGVKATLEYGKHWLPKIFKGIGPVTMDKWAARIAPMVGPAIALMGSVYDYYQARKAEEQQLKRQQRQHEKIIINVNSMVDGVYEHLVKELEDSLQDTFTPLIKELEQPLAKLSQQTGGVEADLATLKQLDMRCQAF